ncbi:MAG TPA: SlyX family protein [Gammaproteobacteria bacterium]|nr:SlyX family protein [Gammaproteobacteria bacterium]
MKTSEERIIELETKVAYQEDAIQQLNDIVAEQQRKLDRVESSLKTLAVKFQDVSEGISNINPLHEKPPHY